VLAYRLLSGSLARGKHNKEREAAGAGREKREKRRKKRKKKEKAKKEAKTLLASDSEKISIAPAGRFLS